MFVFSVHIFRYWMRTDNDIADKTSIYKSEEKKLKNCINVVNSGK